MLNISTDQLIALLDKLQDKDWFNTPYPIPSVPAKSEYYDPFHKRKRLWGAGVFPIVNKDITEKGLVKQIRRFQNIPGGEKLVDRMVPILRHVVNKTEELPKKNYPDNFREFYGPEDGKGYRIKNFSWAVSTLHLDKSNLLLNELEQPQEKVEVKVS